MVDEVRSNVLAAVVVPVANDISVLLEFFFFLLLRLVRNEFKKKKRRRCLPENKSDQPYAKMLGHHERGLVRSVKENYVTFSIQINLWTEVA